MAEYIESHRTNHPGDDHPELLTQQTQASDTSVSDTPTINTWTTRFQSNLADKHAAQTDMKQHPKSIIPGAISYSDVAAGDCINSMHQTLPQNQSAMSSPTNSRMTAPSLREQHLEDRIHTLESKILQQQEPGKHSPSASIASTVASARSVQKSEFEMIMAQQMQMIAALVESNKAANQQMEQQMELITNLQQTVAYLVIGVSDWDSDASTITSNKQQKR